MLAASYWSLLSPAIELAEKSSLYGDEGQLAFIPISIGFALGAAFVYAADVLLPYLVGIYNIKPDLTVVGSAKSTDKTCSPPSPQ